MVRKIVAILFLGLGGGFGFLYYTQFFKWRHCFNDQGRCFDSDTGTVYLEQSGIAWLLLSVFAICFSLIQFWRLRG